MLTPSARTIAAMKLVHKKLDQYYSLTDDSAIYRIAIILHLGMKLEYFRLHGWEEEWIEKAEALVHEEYVRVYKKDLPDIPLDKTNMDVSLSTYISSLKLSSSCRGGSYGQGGPCSD
jgi:hypothetical protein